MTDDATGLIAEAEEQIEAWLCELDVEWGRILADAHAHATRVVEQAEVDANALLATASRIAARQLADAEAEADRVRALAVESHATARTLALAADAAATGRVDGDDLASLAHAVERLRIELSRVVEAAFDALPAVEATAAALAASGAPPAALPRRRGLVRRLFSRA